MPVFTYYEYLRMSFSFDECICLGILFPLLLSGCTPDNPSGTDRQETGPPVKDHVELQFARGFDIMNLGRHKLVKVYDPWQNARQVTCSYLLGKESTGIPDSLLHLPFIKTPVKKMVCLSTTHLAMIGKLGQTGSIAGVSGSERISNPEIRKMIDRGKIMDVGTGRNLNYERIMVLEPDVVVSYGISNEVASMLSKLGSLDIPVVLNAEYLEMHPLGKAEWIRFIGAFFNEDEMARDTFRCIADRYRSMKEMTENVREKPVVLSGLPWKDTWWVPGGNTYAARLIMDAGGIWTWSGNPSREAIPLDIESVYDRASEADIWINTGAARTPADILAVDPRLGLFRAFKNGSLFNNDRRASVDGGNDYWESGPVNPDLILKDLIRIFHPHLLPGHRLIYYRKLP